MLSKPGFQGPGAVPSGMALGWPWAALGRLLAALKGSGRLWATQRGSGRLSAAPGNSGGSEWVGAICRYTSVSYHVEIGTSFVSSIVGTPGGEPSQSNRAGQLG